MSENGPDVTIIDCEGSIFENHRGFYFHSGEDLSSAVQGFTITEGFVRDYGGGMLIENSNPTVTNCTFSANTADRREPYSQAGGGGMANVENSSPMVTNCTFSENSANQSGGMYNDDSSPTVNNCTFSGNKAEGGFGGSGGGMYNAYSSSTVTNCTFSQNDAYYGGGMYNAGNSPTVTNCTFSENSAGGGGGGMYNAWSKPTVTNCTFSENSATTGTWGGGGMSNSLSSPTVINCTFSGNSADHGGGINNSGSSPTVTNCILWGDLPDEIYNTNKDPIVTYSDVERGYPGEGNIDADPMFVDPDSSDYHLSNGSPCIDSGTDAGVYEDYEGDIRPYGHGFDMGVDESPYEVAFNLTLAPNDSLTIHRGEELYFSALIQNNVEEIVTGDYWLSVLLPNSNELLIPQGLLNLPNPISGQVQGNDFFNISNELFVPTIADTGSYQLIGRIGNYPSGIIDEESFGFRVVE
jgi:hypothetical protein